MSVDGESVLNAAIFFQNGRDYVFDRPIVPFRAYPVFGDDDRDDTTASKLFKALWILLN